MDGMWPSQFPHLVYQCLLVLSLHSSLIYGTMLNLRYPWFFPLFDSAYILRNHKTICELVKVSKVELQRGSRASLDNTEQWCLWEAYSCCFISSCE
jgi:hypothetical protein